jgi:hypothetical protein
MGRHRAKLLAVLGLSPMLTFALVGCGGSGNSSPASGSTGQPARAIPVAVSASQLRALAAAAGHPIYWAGTAPGTYEFTTIADGRSYVRYLPPGVPVGSPLGYLTVGTYVQSSPPFAAVRKAALGKRATIKPLRGGGLAIQYRTRPQSVYLVFPGARYEVEVYDPSPARALALAASGKVAPVH